MITKWSGKAEVSESSLQSVFVWPLKDEAGKMWSGPEPQICTGTRKYDLTLEEPTTEMAMFGGVSDTSIPGTFDEGCYDYFGNRDIFRVTGAPSYGMTQQVRRRIYHLAPSRIFLYW